MKRDDLRPLERAVLRRRDDGLSIAEIAERFRRSPDHIERIIGYSRLPRPTGERRAPRGDLRPLERRVLTLIAEGHDFDHLSTAFSRSAAHMRRVAGLAHLRKARALLG